MVDINCMFTKTGKTWPEESSMDISGLLTTNGVLKLETGVKEVQIYFNAEVISCDELLEAVIKAGYT